MNSEPHLELKMKINFHHSYTVFALQIGGYYLTPFVTATTVLLDRNIVSMADNIFNEVKRDGDDVEANKYWFSFLNRPDITLNPALCAMEGNPSNNNDFKEEYESAALVLKKVFPLADVYPLSKEALQASNKIMLELADRHQKELEFLLQVVPIVAIKHSNKNLKKKEDEVVKMAIANGLKVPSLTLLAVLSCLYDSKDKTQSSIARKVVKPKITYSKKMAHNMLSDLRALEVLIQSDTLSKSPLAFLTCDKNLAAFWVSSQTSNILSDESTGQTTFKITISEVLFSALTDDERVALSKRIESSFI